MRAGSTLPVSHLLATATQLLVLSNTTAIAPRPTDSSQQTAARYLSIWLIHTVIMCLSVFSAYWLRFIGRDAEELGCTNRCLHSATAIYNSKASSHCHCTLTAVLPLYTHCCRQTVQGSALTAMLSPCRQTVQGSALTAASEVGGASSASDDTITAWSNCTDVILHSWRAWVTVLSK